MCVAVTTNLLMQSGRGLHGHGPCKGQQVSCTQKGLELGSMCSGHHLQILNKFWTRNPHLYSIQNLKNDIACPKCRWLYACESVWGLVYILRNWIQWEWWMLDEGRKCVQTWPSPEEAKAEMKSESTGNWPNGNGSQFPFEIDHKYIYLNISYMLFLKYIICLQTKPINSTD